MGLADQQRIHVQLLAVLLVAGSAPAEVTLKIAAVPSNSFDPRVALGAGIDGHEEGEVTAKLSPNNVGRMRGAGLQPLIYRLRTELAGEAWHWNSQGTWSDPAHAQGYWTSAAAPSHDPIAVSYGYRLPRRGNTIDQANNDGYSRIDDGDPDTFWKSNPYLGHRPQWVVVDLGRKRRFNTVRIEWGEPRAAQFHFEYSSESFIDITADSNWLPLPSGATKDLRWLRIAMERGTSPSVGDWRDRTGFAIRELSAGYTDASGHFTDYLKHAPSRAQTTIWVSSTDPWHRAVDRDPNVEQPGIDLTFQSGLSNGLPVILAVPVLYDIPENAAALMAYVRARGYPVTDVELGEEPEEQFTMPEDYGALSHAAMDAIRAAGVNPRFGGPSLILLQPNLSTDAEWMARLYRYYKATSGLDALGFFSFEWYPFDDVCGDSSKQLAESTALLTGALRKLADAGLPRTLPWYMTEYGFSAYGAQAEVDLPGALLNAESVALFLTSGGARAFLYGYEPGELLHDRSCSWGNNMLFLDDVPTSTYWAARMISQVWAAPEGGLHQTVPVTTNNPLVSAYALRRPNGELSILVINKSDSVTESLTSPVAAPFTVTRFSGEQYRWLAAGKRSRATRSQPPVPTRQDSALVELPPYSLTVITGKAYR